MGRDSWSGSDNDKILCCVVCEYKLELNTQLDEHPFGNIPHQQKDDDNDVITENPKFGKTQLLITNVITSEVWWMTNEYNVHK